MRNKPARCGYNNICTVNQGFLFLFERCTIVATIYSEGAYRGKICKALYSLIYLNGKFPGRNDDQGIYRFTFLLYNIIDERKQVSSCFSGTCLGACYNVAVAEYNGYCLFLYGCWFFKTH